MCLEKWGKGNIEKMKINEKFKRYAHGGSTGVLLVGVKRNLDDLARDTQNSIFENMRKQDIVTMADLIQETHIGTMMESLRKINSYFGTDYETDPFKIKEYYSKPLLGS